MAKEAHIEDIRDAFEGDHIEHGVKFRPNDMAEMLEKRGIDGLKADVSGGIDKFKQAYAEKIQSLHNEFNLSDQQVNRLNKALDRDVAKISERADEMLVAGHALEQAEKQLEDIDEVVALKLPPEPDGDDPAHDAWEEQVDQLHEQIEEELNEHISNARDVFEHKASRLDDLMDDTPRVQDAIATMGDNLAGTLDDNYPIPVYDRDDLNGEDSDEAKETCNI